MKPEKKREDEIRMRAPKRVAKPKNRAGRGKASDASKDQTFLVKGVSPMGQEEPTQQSCLLGSDCSI